MRSCSQSPSCFLFHSFDLDPRYVPRHLLRQESQKMQMTMSPGDTIFYTDWLVPKYEADGRLDVPHLMADCYMQIDSRS